jgi:heat shock protein beta
MLRLLSMLAALSLSLAFTSLSPLRAPAFLPSSASISRAAPAPAFPAAFPAPAFPLFSTATEPAAASATEPESFKFDAEVSRVMDIIINSLYSDRAVFLRELVSNAADACDKRRFLSLTSGSSAAPAIRLRGDKGARTLVIEDEGVGMSRAELVENLGRIAQSGTAKFAEAMSANKDDLSLIGQFGVGFYSGFLVADRMTVETRSAGSEAAAGEDWHRWASSSGDSYTVEGIPKPEPLDESSPFESGTRITLHLKDDCLSFAESFTLTDLLRKYSEFIDFPIDVWAEKTE